ncbi:uncharacterized protein LOC114859484 isoform X2 [Betta splendens]|uniref:Uncharacterized protein LOC114859484 isoform X2 n=1 Tax=Betta splendens TaxID=158456 RepID=A0A6P7N5K4_BETSP|nr:uncharacterized protein LOC114859484 isoform X2 [Betta splendens]
MGCRFTRAKAKTHESAHHRLQEELHFVDEYGQPITMQVEGRRAHAHRRRRSHTERQWEALRVMGLMEGQHGQGNGYRAGPYYGHMTMTPDLYPTSGHMMMPPDVYPPNGYLSRASNEQPPGGGYLPTVSYSLDHLDRLDYQSPEMLPYQPNSENCLIGCYNTEDMEPKNFSRQSDYRPAWRPDRPLGFLPLSELDSGLGCGPGSPHHRVALSEAETDAMSSLPGHTASSQGSSSSSESLISSELSDSGFHSVSTGEHRRLHKIHGNHRQAHHLRSSHSPREQRGRWDLESIPETTLMSHPGAAQASRCTVGNSTTTTVHFHRAERSPTLPRHHSPPSPSAGCRTEPCQRRALWLEQQQGRVGTIEAPGRSRTINDLSLGQRQRRASHPNTTDPNMLTTKAQYNQSGAASSTLGPRSRASYPSNTDRTSLNNHPNTRNSKATNRSREEDALSKSPGSGSSGVSDWRGFQTLGSCNGNNKVSSSPSYSTLGALQRSPASPPSPRSRLSNPKSARNQMLRARAYRLARERSEVTTDEEVRGRAEGGGEEEGEEGRWAGRYWSRTERRRHLALSRQQKERRGGVEEHNGGVQSSQMVLELSHMKQNRLRNSKLLDDWTTVEELLTHGTRVESDSQLCPSPLLSVTTV